MEEQLCALCNKKKANKQNTHYLTDAIIRQSLNYNGCTLRESGAYWDLSSSQLNPSSTFNFQRNTPPEKVEEILGHKPTEQEIENAKKRPFSVDNVFCSECEKKFSEIEELFINQILPQLRGKDLQEIKEKVFLEKEARIIRMFFLLQIWRTSVCTNVFSLSQEYEKKIKEVILNANLYDVSRIFEYPLAITFLNTSGGNNSYTENLVGFSNDRNPFFIFMNDFIVQFYEKKELIQFNNLAHINSEENYKEYINIEEETFIIQIKSNKERVEIMNHLYRERTLLSYGRWLKNLFRFLEFVWRTEFIIPLPIDIKKEYLLKIGKGVSLQTAAKIIIDKYTLSKKFI